MMFTSLVHSTRRSFATSAAALQMAAAPKPIREMTLTIPEKMVSVTIDEESGVVTHNYLKEDNGKKRTFASEALYKKWLSQQRTKMYKHYRDNLSPLQFWVTQQKGTERAFTGAYWETKEVGMYRCVVCS